MTENRHSTDVAVIGAGPVGLFAVFECGMLKIKCHVVDALDVAGGQCAALYPEKPIYDIPGYPVIEAAALIDKLQEQARPFHPEFHLGQRVESCGRGADGRFLLTTSAGTKIDCRAVVIAAGVGAFGPNRPPIPGIESFENTSVFYFVKRREDLKGKRVVIAGGGDSAVDWALALADVAERVMVVHRRPKFRAAPESAARLQKLADEKKIDMIVPYQLAGLEGVQGKLSAVLVADMNGQEKRVPADVLLPFFGLAMSLGPIAEWGLNFENNRISVDPATCATNVSGIYAVGDIATYPGKLKLILSGFAEAALAAHAIYPLIHPDRELHFEYSTTTGVPGLA
jgi:thioredoxin reductase (NADPH)